MGKLNDLGTNGQEIYLSASPQVLMLEGGYKFLDVRSDRERDFGAIRGSIHVPYSKDRKSFEDNKMRIHTTKVAKDVWLKSVNAKIPKKDTKLVVHDMTGKIAIECLEVIRHTNER